MPDQEFKVNTTGLNLRSEPRVRAGNLIASLTLGDIVTKIAESSDPAWWQISTTIQGTHVEGFVSHRFLIAADRFDSQPLQTGITEAHLRRATRTARNQTSGRAFPLNEPGQPGREGATDAEKAASLARIIRHLNVAVNARYRPGNGQTFCNIYAYDY